MPTTADTIVAIATPPGEGGVGIVRLSGARALAIGSALVYPARHSPTTPFRSHQLVYGHVQDESGRRIDEVLAAYMAAPHTYTAEDVFEIHCHGGQVPLQLVVDLALQQGARPAERGEFTLRAFLNGRLDLSQAEAVLDVVQARTPTALHVAVEHLAGSLAQRLAPVGDELMGVLAYLEASIDFVEEGIPPTAQTTLLERLESVQGPLRQLLETARAGVILRDGLRAVLAGAPNAGKSSLLNRLLRTERAIVTPIAGTTRDTVEEIASIRGLPVFLVDTAGLTESSDPVEQLGVERSRAAIASAGLLLLVVDSSCQLDERVITAFHTARSLAPQTPAVLVLNKADLPQQLDSALVYAVLAESDTLSATAFPARSIPQVAISALSGAGIDELEEAMARVVVGEALLAPDTAMIQNARHRQAVAEALAALETTCAGLRECAPLDLVCSDLRAAVSALGSITGQDVTEDLLSRIFSQFCIGK